MPFERGAVYSAPLLLLGRGDDIADDRRKYLVVLQSPTAMDRNASQFAFVVASTDQTRGSGARPFEVQLGEADGFRHPTIVDGRWVYSVWREKLTDPISTEAGPVTVSHQAIYDWIYARPKGELRQLATMEAAGEPERVPAEGNLDDRLLWVGPDDRGVVLEMIAVDLPDCLLVIHAMPIALRRNR